jgi:hypothetical protein
MLTPSYIPAFNMRFGLILYLPLTLDLSNRIGVVLMARQIVTRNTYDNKQTSSRLFAILFGIIESLLAFRLIFRLLGANPENGFVSGIYSVTKPIVSVFQGIFSGMVSDGLETTSVFEPGTLIAMIVVALIAWLIFKLITPRESNRVEKTEYSQTDGQNK